MVDLPWWIPQERIVIETEEEIASAYNGGAGKSREIKEYRDEANRPWWNFFDEYEYRKNVPSWTWFGTGSTPEERKLLLKLDLHIVIYAMVGYWCKYFDASNLTNAYVSGMKEDIGMKGNDLINTQVLLLVANIIFCLPMAYLLPRVPTNYLLFGTEFLWSLFTLVTFAAPNAKALKAFRFFLGGFETIYFPVIHYTLANYYKTSEISSRASIFYCGQYLGILTAGLLQGAISDSLNGVSGLAGWKWMFIIDGIVSFAVAFVAIWAIPGNPFKCYSIFLTDDDIKLCRKRMRENGTDGGEELKSFFDLATWKKMLLSWHFYILSLAGIGGFCANATSAGGFALWLKSLHKYEIGELNRLTAIPPALGLAYVIFTCFTADITKKRFGMVMVAQCLNLISCIVLAVWNVPLNAKWFAFYFGYWSWSQLSVFNPLVNDILRHDQNLRSIEWVIIYIIGMQAYAWVSKVAWPTVEAPQFTKGYITAGTFGMFQAIMMCLGYFFYKRDERARAAQEGIILYNSANGDPFPEAIADGQSLDNITFEKTTEKVKIKERQDTNSDID